MTDTDSSRSDRPAVLTVHDPDQARILTDPGAKRYLRPFVARTLSLSEAADEAGCALNAMHYRVGRFVAAGLLDVVGERVRPGRPIKLYRSSAESYVIPLEATPFADPEESLWTLLEPGFRRVARGLARSYQQRGGFGQRLFRDDRGVVLTGFHGPGPIDVDSFDPGRFDYGDIVLPLDGVAVAATASELFAVLQTAFDRAVDGGRPHLLQIALVPLDDALDPVRG